MQPQTVHYDIVAFHRPSGNLQVIFHHPGEQEGVPFSIPLTPDHTGAYPSGSALDEWIRHHIPHELLAARRAGTLPANTLASLVPTRLFEAGVAFVEEDQAFLFSKRALVRNNGLPLPIEVY